MSRALSTREETPYISVTAALIVCAVLFLETSAYSQMAVSNSLIRPPMFTAEDSKAEAVALPSKAPAPPETLPIQQIQYSQAPIAQPLAQQAAPMMYYPQPMYYPMPPPMYYPQPQPMYYPPPYQMANYAQPYQQQPPIQQQTVQTNPQEAPKMPESTLSRLMPFRITSPLLDTCKITAKHMNPFLVPSEPHRGIGRPLVNSSWLSRPKYIGIQGGVLGGSELISGMLEQDSGGIVSITYGKYNSHYWGWEGRLSYASLSVKDTDAAKEDYVLYHSLTSEGFVPGLVTRSNRILMLDFGVHYYPLGNARWRPFFKLGIGVAGQKFDDTFGVEHTPLTISMPIGGGIRYWWNEQVALNFEITDNILFQSGSARTQNNFSFMFGVTYAFGRSSAYKPTTYWPFNPSAKY